MLQKSKYHKWEIRVKYSNFPFAFGYALLLGAYKVSVRVANMYVFSIFALCHNLKAEPVCISPAFRKFDTTNRPHF